jgi:hypothetical protein
MMHFCSDCMKQVSPGPWSPCCRDRVLTAREAGEAVVDHLHRARKHGPRSNAYLWYGLPQEQAIRERMDQKRERLEAERKAAAVKPMDFGEFLFNLGADMARIRGAA